MFKNWKYRNSSTCEQDHEEIARQLKVSPVLIRLMLNRGLSYEQMRSYLFPDLKNDLSSFSAFPGLNEVVDIFSKCLTSNKKVAIWGDYDVDGITGVALLNDFLVRRGYSLPIRNYFPNRWKEGYGLNSKGIEKLHNEGIEAMITVDCGIANILEVDKAKSFGMTILVTDHHEMDKNNGLPSADAIFNPRIATCPCPDLAGVGVAFYVAAALNKKLPGNPIDMQCVLDLVALGSIADIVNLVGENRVLTKFGLESLSRGDRPGIYAMKEANGLGGKTIVNPGQVSFRLAPMINVAGRLNDPYIAFHALLTRDPEEASQLAAKLQDLNEQRKNIEQKILKEALLQTQDQVEDLGIVVYAEEWHEGVIGIVASKLVEIYYRPVIILTRAENGIFKGSARSIPEFDIHGGLTECTSTLVSFGGHKQAAGLSVTEENIGELKKKFCNAIEKQIGKDLYKPTQKIDLVIESQDINLEFVKQLDLLQPCGMGNPGPIFETKPLKVKTCSFFGKENNHLILKLENGNNKTITAKGWQMRNMLEKLFDSSIQDNFLYGEKVNIVCSPKINNWNGNTNVELEIKDYKVQA